MEKMADKIEEFFFRGELSQDPIFFKIFFPQTVWPHYGVLTVREKHLV